MLLVAACLTVHLLVQEDASRLWEHVLRGMHPMPISADYVYRLSADSVEVSRQMYKFSRQAQAQPLSS